jgi:hypothetical protein
MKIRYFPGGTHRKVIRGSANVLKEHDSRSVQYGSAGASRATISPCCLGNPRTFTESMDVFRLTTICRGPASLESNRNHRERLSYPSEKRLMDLKLIRTARTWRHAG